MRVMDPNLIDECQRRIQTKKYLLCIKADEHGDVYFNDMLTTRERFAVAISDGVFMHRTNKGAGGIEAAEIYVFPRNVILHKDGEYFLLNSKAPDDQVFIWLHGHKKACMLYIIDNGCAFEYHGLPDEYVCSPAILPNVLRGMFPEHFTTLEGKGDTIL